MNAAPVARTFDGNSDCSPQQGFAACAGFKKKDKGKYGVLVLVNDRTEDKTGLVSDKRTEAPSGTIDLGKIDADTGELKGEKGADEEEKKAEVAVGPQSKQFTSSIFVPDVEPVKADFGKIKLVENAGTAGKQLASSTESEDGSIG